MANLELLNRTYSKMAYLLLKAAREYEFNDQLTDLEHALHAELVDFVYQLESLSQDHIDVETIKDFILDELVEGEYDFDIERMMFHYLTFNKFTEINTDAWPYHFLVMKWIREWIAEHQEKNTIAS